MNTCTEIESDSPLLNWVSDDDRPFSFIARLVQETALPSDDPITADPLKYVLNSARTQRTSEIVHLDSDHDLVSMASESLPALTRGNSMASTSSRVSTDTASIIDGGFILESEDGILTVPTRHRPDADLHCPFDILDCTHSFSELVELKIHVFSHFRGHPLPAYAPCFACSRVFFQTPMDDSALAWNKLLNHMAYEHYRGAEGRVRVRPDIAVMRYMWNKGIITDAQFTRFQLLPPSERRVAATNNNANSRLEHIPEAPMAPPAPIPSEIQQHLNQTVGFRDEPFTNTAGRRQDRRQQSQLRSRVMRGSSNL